jgi:hypothetical protein
MTYVHIYIRIKHTLDGHNNGHKNDLSMRPMLMGPTIYKNENVFVFVITIQTALRYWSTLFCNETKIIFVVLVLITISLENHLPSEASARLLVMDTFSTLVLTFLTSLPEMHPTYSRQNIKINSLSKLPTMLT